MSTMEMVATQEQVEKPKRAKKAQVMPIGDKQEIVIEPKLSASEKARLQKLESVVQENLYGYMEMGKALMEIRDSRLYRASYVSFEDYLKHRWTSLQSMGARYAHALIAAAKVSEQVKEAGLPIPDNFSQARELVKTPEGARLDVWRTVNENADGGPVTGKTIKAVREAYKAVEQSDEDQPAAEERSESEIAKALQKEANARNIKEETKTTASQVYRVSTPRVLQLMIRARAVVNAYRENPEQYDPQEMLETMHEIFSAIFKEE